MKKKLGVSATLLIALFFGMFLVSGFCFTEAPTRTDPQGDAVPQCDILSVWVDNDNEMIMFKIEILGFFDATFEEGINSENWLIIGININNETGEEIPDWFWIPVDYMIFWFSLDSNPLYFVDIDNGTNSAEGYPEVAYYTQSNHNHTLEIGYKLKTYNDNGDGYLNISLGQTINVVFYVTVDFILAKGEEPPLKVLPDEDWCPYFPDFIIYTLEREGLPLWAWILIGVGIGGGATAGVLVLLRRKEII